MNHGKSFVTAVVLASMLCPACAGAQAAPEIFLYVNDFVGVLTSDEIGTLDEICYELDQVTSDEIAIVVVNSTQPEGIDIFAVELFEASGIGKDDEDNGVLVLVSTEEELWRIEVGYGLEGILNDAKVGTIGRENLEPYLAVGDYYPGIFYTVAALVEELTSDPDRINEDGHDIELLGIDYWQLALALVIVGVVGVATKGRVFFWIGGILTRGRFGGGRSGGGGAKGRF
ncbi:MAG TPA: TPM domain-containing protein [Thermoplasmata archaeon]|nr:TPM domain-containing protein [Thermoplasmata archaeon]